jgi:succinate-semialdehyde dehydrogenase/glutarate-semialdehyde dehydrogenase
VNPKEISESPLLQHLSAYIAGAFLKGATGNASFAVKDPASGVSLASLPSYGAPETTQAVEAAEAALALDASSDDRKRWLRAIAAAHSKHRDDLGRIITLENGKPLAEARGEVDYAAGFYSAAADQLESLEPRRLASEPKQHAWTVWSRPAGVAALITPWNFPLAMLAKKAAAALGAGAPIVVKPAEKTPLSAIALFHLLHELSLPPGLVNLVFGDAPAIGRVFCEHPAVRVVSFTGSTAVGKLLAAQAAPHIKRMALELGGNAPFIVFEDAQLDAAVDQLMANKFRCSGQTCVCTNRVYVQSGVAPKFLERLTARVADLKVGPGMDPETTVGPLIDRAGFAKVSELVQDALTRGARATQGGVAPVPAEDAALYYPPTVLQGVTAQMRCTREEVFGPVLPVILFESEEEVLQAANATEYGLAAYVHTNDLVTALRVSEDLEYGLVAINDWVVAAPEAPFGGVKQSGVGRESGPEGLHEYLEAKTRYFGGIG